MIVELLYGCGLRVSKLVNLKKQDFNFDEKLIHIKLAKGRKDMYVEIPNSIKEKLEYYSNLNNEEIFFPSSRGGKLTTVSRARSPYTLKH